MATTITPRIVDENVTVTKAPTPSQLQRSGALISLGGTTLTVDAYQYFGNLSDFETVLSAAGNYAELTKMATTFFGQGTKVGFYVLELGTESTAGANITALQTWISSQSTQVFYSYLVPATWDGVTALVTLANGYASPNSKTYFHVTTTSANISLYANIKSVIASVPSPTAASTEFQAAALFYYMTALQPSAATPGAILSYQWAYGVTPWAQTPTNATTINTILTAYGNVILTGAEGGISTASIFKGTTMDGEQIAWWYSVDWFQIQAKQAMAAAILNGANSIPKLLYDQNGINTLEAVANNEAAASVSFGLNLTAVITATPFYTYTQANPGDYNAGIYNGFTATVTPVNGFLTITFNIDAIQF